MRKIPKISINLIRFYDLQKYNDFNKHHCQHYRDMSKMNTIEWI